MTKTLFVTFAAAVTAATLSTAASAAAPAATAAPAGDAVNGAKVFNQCKVCHVAEKGVNRVGPSLWGVVGRKASTVPGYTYSAANKKSGLTWDAKTLFVYLEAPQKLVPGTKMSFAGLKKPQDRADVIAFLKTKA
jgi:cytochrome c